MSDAAPPFEHDVSESIRARAMSLPEAVEGSSCVNRAFSAGGKNFVFYGEKDLTCTLRLKRAEGWTKVVFSPHDAPPQDDLEAWITESYRLLAPKRLVARLESS